MNQVFGEKSFVANCIWQKRYSRENREAIGDAHEYLLVFAPNPAKFKARRGRIGLTQKQQKPYKNPDDPNETDPTKRFQAITMTAQGTRPNQMYKIDVPGRKKPLSPPEGRCWSILEEDFLELRRRDRISFGKKGNGVPRVIRYLSEVEGLVPWTWWPHEEVGHTGEAKKEIQAIFGTQTAFDTPKPVRLMERILQIGAPEKDALVLDFFAGSGTTGQAVLQLNKSDGGNRRFVLMSNREESVENPTKNLCRDVCGVRLRAVINGYMPKDGKPVAPVPGSFAYLVAKPIPMHRLEEALNDDMVWTFALQACDHPITPVSGAFSASIEGNHLVAYCANTKASTLGRLRATVEAHQGRAVILTWAADAVTTALGELSSRVSLVEVPSDLKRAFHQGNADGAPRGSIQASQRLPESQAGWESEAESESESELKAEAESEFKGVTP